MAHLRFPALFAYGFSMLCYIRTLRDFPVGRIAPIVMVALLLLFVYGAFSGVKVKPVHIAEPYSPSPASFFYLAKFHE